LRRSAAELRVLGRLEYYVVQQEVPVSTEAMKLDRRALRPPPSRQRAFKRFPPQVELAKVSWTVHRSPFERVRNLPS
jgi:hypothetical protein